MKKKKKFSKIALYVIIVIVGIGMLYPVVWMFCSAFKSNSEIFGSLTLSRHHLIRRILLKDGRE